MSNNTMSQQIYDNIERVIPTLHGWCPVDKAKRMVDIILTLQKPVCVELGVFAGRSLLPIAWACQQTNGHVTGIDPWAVQPCLDGKNSNENDEWWSKIDYNYFYTYTVDLMKSHGVENVTTIIRNKSENVVGNFSEHSISFIHQDGNHSEEVTIKEVNQWSDKIVPGGYWVFDDANWETTKAAQQLLEDKGYTCIFTASENAWKIYQKPL